MQQQNCHTHTAKKKLFLKQWTIHFHDIFSQEILISAFYAYIRSHLTYVTPKRLRKKVTLNFTAQLKEVQKSYSYLIIETNVRFYRAVISLRDDNLSLLLHVFKYDKMSCTLFEYLIFIGRNFRWMATIWFPFSLCFRIFFLISQIFWKQFILIFWRRHFFCS